jgi:Ribbon-helix-helix protein, copG family
LSARAAKKKAPRKRAPGGGRPPLAPELRADQRITVRLASADHALLQRLSAALGVDQAEALRVALRESVAAHKLSS